jgi:hypothetical protein
MIDRMMSWIEEESLTLMNKSFALIKVVEMDNFRVLLPFLRLIATPKTLTPKSQRRILLDTRKYYAQSLENLQNIVIL